MRIVHLLEDYLEDDDEQNENENIDNIELDDVGSDKKNNSFILKNPNKQTRSKGRPKGTKRIKAYHENEFLPSTSKQYRCGLCEEMGHNKQNCNKL